MIEILILCSTGIVVGFLAGLFGIGGGLIIVPIVTFLMIHFNDLPGADAYAYGIGSSMLSIIFTGSMATFFHMKNNNFNFSYVSNVIGYLFFGSLIGSYIIHFANFYFLKYFFIFYCFFSALKLLNRANLNFLYSLPLKTISFIFGALSSIVGIGGGTLFVPYLEAKKIDIRLAISSSSILGVVIGIGTLLGFVSQKLILETSPLLNSFFDYGNIYIKSFIFLTLPSIFTIFISTKLLVSLNQNIIKKLFAYLLISIGLISLFNL